MKRLFKRSLSAVLALVIALGCMGMTAFAAETKGSGWKFETNDSAKTATVIGIDGDVASSMSVPSVLMYDGSQYAVTAIEDGIGADESALKKLTIGESVVSVGQDCFSGCTALESVTIYGAATIENGAFNACTALKKVNISKNITVLGTAFDDCHEDLVFVYEIDDAYFSEEAVLAELKSVFGDDNWTKGENDDFYTWNDKIEGYPVITTGTEINADNSAPSVSISVGEKSWNTSVSAAVNKPECCDVENISAAVKFKDSGNPASGIRYFGYYLASSPVAKVGDIQYTKVDISECEKDGDWYSMKFEVGKAGVLYVWAEDMEGNDTFVNTPYLLIDEVAPVVTVTNETQSGISYSSANNDLVFGAKKDSNTDKTAYTSSVTYSVKAEDAESGIAKVYYLDRAAAFKNADEMMKDVTWMEISNNSTVVRGGNGKTSYVIYFKVVDNSGHVSYASTDFFTPGDNAAPVITGVYYENGEKKEVTFKDGDKLSVKGGIKLTAADDCELKSFTYEGKINNNAGNLSKVGYVLETADVYTVVATDETKNTTKVTITVNNTDTAAPVVNISGYSSEGEFKELQAKTGNGFLYYHPATIKVTDAGNLAYVTYSYVTENDKGESEEKTVSVKEADAKAGFVLKDYNVYTVEVMDATFNTVKFTVTITEPEHKITAMTVDTGNEKDKTQLDCMGGSFKATVTGSDIYHKIAVFNGETLVGKILTIGSNEKPMNTVEIAKDTITLPANLTDKAAEYVIRYYDVDTEDKDITSKTGVELSKVTVAAKATTINVDPTELTYTSAGATLDIKIHSNCEFSVLQSDTSWIVLAIKSGPVKNDDGTLSTVITVTVPKNTGLDREGTVKFTTLDDSKTSVTVKVKQSGVGDAERLAGTDRIKTAVEISKSGWTTASTVIIASGQNFADALSGVPLSAAADAPILLTMNKSSGIEQEVLDEIKRLGAKKAYILGGTSAVCKETEDKLKSEGITVSRLYGDNRYGTSVAIAEELYKITDKSFTKLYFANAWNYPDALSVSAAAAIEGNPVLYMPTTGEVEEYVSEFIKANKCKTGVILGGENAVSKKGYDSLTHLGMTMSRISGEDRYETSVKINETYSDLFTGKSVAVATGLDFPDALAGGALCAKLKVPVVLVSEKDTTDAIGYIKSKTPDSLIIFGGTAVISEALAVQLVSAK